MRSIKRGRIKGRIRRRIREGVEYVDAVLFGRQLLLCIVRKES